MVHPVTSAWSGSVHDMKAERFALDSTDTQKEGHIFLKEVRIGLFLQAGAFLNVINFFSKAALPTNSSASVCLGVNGTGWRELRQ